MNLDELKSQHIKETYLFDPSDFGRIYAFVDFSNVRNWAKCFWPVENKEYLRKEIDIKKLANVIEMVTPVKKFFYYGHYKEHPELPNDHESNKKYKQSIFRIDKARKSGFKVRTKDIKEISDFNDEGRWIGKINKCNFDIEMTMDILQKIEKYDTALLFSGDSDFHILLSHLRSKKKKVVTICARDFVSKELHDNSDLYIPADPFKDHLIFEKESTITQP